MQLMSNIAQDYNRYNGRNIIICFKLIYSDYITFIFKERYARKSNIRWKN